ncbi:hypothetical protein ACEWY4_025228 [Coilia grayii]|uniref:B30.2/SPRY domain-containing protein n=1 Tax=Coilia grayii TaxID=363190 RepID=A0ABD1IX20_9TELE
MLSSGCYKLAVVLVCVLLLAVTIALCITTLKIKDLQLRYKNLAEEKDQLQVHCTNMTAEKAQLETELSAMTGERDELQRRLCERVNVTLDPDSAHPYLILSADGKEVKLGDKRQNVPDTLKRFNQTISVLGKEGFSSGKFYYEVQVKGKTKWDIGVAKESINRKGEITLGPKYGYWAVWLRNSTYAALASPSVPHSLKGKPQRVGVFVDYDAASKQSVAMVTSRDPGIHPLALQPVTFDLFSRGESQTEVYPLSPQVFLLVAFLLVHTSWFAVQPMSPQVFLLVAFLLVHTSWFAVQYVYVFFQVITLGVFIIILLFLCATTFGLPSHLPPTCWTLTPLR